nr:hypothetical protein [Sulfuricurvum sp.]
PTTTPAAATSADPVAHQSDITSVRNQLADKASLSSVTALQQQMAEANGKITTLQSTPAGGGITQAQLDAAIAKAISDFKAGTDPWNSSSSSSSSSSSGTTTTVGGIAVTLDKTQVISTSTDTGNKDVTVTINNQSGTSKNISLLISLTAYSPSAYDVAKVGYGIPAVYMTGSPPNYANAPQAKSTLSGFTTAQSGIVQLNPDVTTLISKVYWVTPNVWMDNSTTKSIWINFDVKSVDVITWTLEVKAL